MDGKWARGPGYGGIQLKPRRNLQAQRKRALRVSIKS
jgi:hypothetical protein